MAREIFSQNPHEFNKALAMELKKIKEIEVPEWSLFVKSGVSRERAPESPDFWYIRMASILRQLYINGVVGVERLRVRYGGRKNRGDKPAKFKRSSGKMIRLMLQQAEKIGLVEKVSDTQFGRRLTLKGREFLDSIKVKNPEIISMSDYIGKDKKIENHEEINEANDQFVNEE